MGTCRRSLAQLSVAFPYRQQYQTGKGLWSATFTACPWYTFQGRCLPGDGMGARRVWAAGYEVEAHVAPTDGSGRVPASIRLSCFCTAAVAVSSCHLPSPSGLQLRASRDSSCRDEPRNLTKNVTCIFFLCSAFPSLCEEWDKLWTKKLEFKHSD